MGTGRAKIHFPDKAKPNQMATYSDVTTCQLFKLNVYKSHNTNRQTLNKNGGRSYESNKPNQKAADLISILGKLC